MKTKEKKEKSIIERLREIRDEMSLEIKDMDHRQLTQYLASKKTLRPASFWEKHK